MAEIEIITRNDVESRVLKAQGPVALDFYQASCTPCRALEPKLERVAREYAGQLPVYRVDIDRDLSVARRFEVMSIPTVLIFRAGKEVARLDRLITEDDLRAVFDRVASA